MRVGINFSYRLIAVRGIARYVENLILHLPVSANIDLVFFVPSKAVPADSVLERAHEVIFIDITNAMLFEHVALPLALRKHHVDLLLNPANTCPLWKGGEKWLTVVHDLIPFKFVERPLSRKWLVNVYMRFIVRYGVLRSDKVITVSANSYNDIVKILGRDRDLEVVYNGYNHEENRTVSTFSSLGLPPKYVFYLGGDGQNKNINRVVAAARMLRSDGYSSDSLVVVGCRRRYNIERLTDAGCTVLSRVDDSTLADIYRCASAFFFPSLYEGFGIPLLEAMHYSGAPILCSDTSSLPEVCGECAYYFDPTNVPEMVDYIEKALNGQLGSKSGLYSLQLSKFNWAKEAEKLCAIISALQDTK